MPLAKPEIIFLFPYRLLVLELPVKLLIDAMSFNSFDYFTEKRFVLLIFSLVIST